MAKGWKQVGTINELTSLSKEEQLKTDRYYNRLKRTTKTLSLKELMEESDNLLAKQQAEDAALLDAFEHNRLKSKDAIKRAIALKKKQEKA